MENFNWFHIINAFFAIFSWRVAMGCKDYSPVWWLNMFASALNGVVVLKAIL